MLIKIDERSAVPIYQQIAAQIRRTIASGELQPGDRLLAVRELADSLGINLHTVRAAYAELRAEHLVDMRRGRPVSVLAGAVPVALVTDLARNLVIEARRFGLTDAEIVDLVKGQCS